MPSHHGGPRSLAYALSYDGVHIFLVVAHAHASTGGAPADPDTFRYPVWMQTRQAYVPPSTEFCMGAQIDPHMMVTVAHCLEGPLSSGMPFYIFRKTDSTHLFTFPVRSIAIHPLYEEDPPSHFIDPYDTAILDTRSPYPAGNLDYKVDFDPYAYIERQPRKEILVNAFGFNREAREVYTGKSMVMSDSGCLRYIDDLIQHEGDHLNQVEKELLHALAEQFKSSPKSLLCSFIKKIDAFQPDPLDKGAPLVFEVKSKSILAGMLVALVPISSTRQYSMVAIYNNISYSSRFIENCEKPQSSPHNQRTAAQRPSSSDDSCRYRHPGSVTLSNYLMLLN